MCTEFYDIDKKFASPEEVNFYQQFFHQDDLILEPMCGTGRLLIPLMQEGYTVHGADNSSSMLQSCKNRATSFGLNPTLFETAIETMVLPHQYNSVIIPLGSFQLLFPREKAFCALINLKKHLKPKGKIILDLFVPWDVLYENNLEELSEKEVALPDGGKIIHRSHNVANKYEQSIFCDSVYTKIIGNKIVATEKEQMHLSWYYRYEVELILEKYGFTNIIYTKEYFGDDTHMIFIAESKGC